MAQSSPCAIVRSFSVEPGTRSERLVACDALEGGCGTDDQPRQSRSGPLARCADPLRFVQRRWWCARSCVPMNRLSDLDAPVWKPGNDVGDLPRVSPTHPKSAAPVSIAGHRSATVARQGRQLANDADLVSRSLGEQVAFLGKPASMWRMSVRAGRSNHFIPQAKFRRNKWLQVATYCRRAGAGGTLWKVRVGVSCFQGLGASSRDTSRQELRPGRLRWPSLRACPPSSWVLGSSGPAESASRHFAGVWSVNRANHMGPALRQFDVDVPPRRRRRY